MTLHRTSITEQQNPQLCIQQINSTQNDSNSLETNKAVSMGFFSLNLQHKQSVLNY